MNILLWIIGIIGYILVLSIAIARSENRRSIPAIAVIVLVLYLFACIVLYLLSSLADSPGMLVYSISAVLSCILVAVGIFKLKDSKGFRPGPTILLILYLASVFFVTLFSRIDGSNSSIQMELFHFFSVYRKTGEMEHTIHHALLNLAMFVPLGGLFFLTPMGGMPHWWSCTGFGLISTVVIETSQLLLRRGICDIDDILMNTAGAFLGYLICRIFVPIFTSSNDY